MMSSSVTAGIPSVTTGRYTITTLTPLLVGDGRELSPIDYMVWKEQVNVLDQARIFKLLARGPRLESYLTQLRKATKLDFASWGGFAQNFSQRRIPFEHPESASIWNTAPSESLFIPTFSANLRGQFIPASAVKGALRTGLVFTRWSSGTLDKIAGSMEDDRLPRRVSEAAENHAGASQAKIVGLSDSEPAAGMFKIYLTRVASLDTRQPGKPQLVWKVAGRGSVPPQRVTDSTPRFAEMATPGSSFTGRWEENKFLENPEFSRDLGWRSSPTPSLLTEAANQYAAAQLDIHLRYSETAGLPDLARSVTELKSELEAARAQPLTCLLCLGWASGFLAKSGFLDTGQETYRRVLRAVPAFGKSMREGVIFPKTRRVVFSGGQPSTIPGWVRLQLSD